MGNVSDAMALILCGGPPPGSSAPVSRISSTELHRKFSDLTTEDLGTVHEPFNFDGDDDGGDDVDCELEWESWIQDLMRQALASTSNDIAVTVTEPASTHHSYPHKRIRPTASSSTFSSITLSDQGRRPSDILPGANMGLLSVDSPALLTAPNVLPFQSTGITTSTVSAGGIVRTRSLITANGGRGRGVARAMDVLSEDGGDDGSQGRHRADRQKRGREENGRGAIASSAPTHSSSMPAPTAANTITSTVTVRESCGRTPSPPPPLQFHSSPGSPRAITSSSSSSALASALASTSASVAGSGASDTASMRSGITTMTSTTTIQLPPPRRSSVAGETTLLPETSPPSRKRRDKAEKKEKGKGKGKQAKSPTRGKVFRPERLVSKLDSALDFVTG